MRSSVRDARTARLSIRRAPPRRARRQGAPWAGLAAFLACLLLPVSPARAAEGPDEAAPESGAWEVLRKHGWHLAAVVGADYLTHRYSTGHGYSDPPLLFSAPGPLDERLREELSGSDSRSFVWDHGLESLKFAVPVTLVAVDLGDGTEMARDLVGFTEALFAKRAVTRFTKDLVGRERPRLEFAAEDGLGPGAVEKLDEKSGNHRSFPSGHASGSFAFAAYLERALARELGPRSTARKVSFSLLYGYAGYIGWTRLRLDKHYLTDVAAGAALGVWIARSSYRHTHPGEYGDRPRRVTLNPPAVVPGGFVVTLAVRTGP